MKRVLGPLGLTQQYLVSTFENTKYNLGAGTNLPKLGQTQLFLRSKVFTMYKNRKEKWSRHVLLSMKRQERRGKEINSKTPKSLDPQDNILISEIYSVEVVESGRTKWSLGGCKAHVPTTCFPYAKIYTTTNLKQIENRINLAIFDYKLRIIECLTAVN